MPFQFGRYSGLLLIFFVHGLVYAFLLLRKGIRNNRSSDKWLSLFLLLCVLYICPWMLGFAGWYEGDSCLPCRNFMFYMPLQQTLFMGPVIYFYLLTLFQPSYRLTKKDALHFLPGALYIIWCLVVFVVDNVVMKSYYLMNGMSDPDFDDWYIIAGLLSLLFYLLLCLRKYKAYKTFIFQQYSFADAVTFRWVRNFLIACLVYFFINLGFHLVQFFGIDLNYTSTWWYYLFFALLFYYIAINGYSASIETRMSFGLDMLLYKQTPLLSSPPLKTDAGVDEIAFEEIDATEKKDFPALDSWKDKVSRLIKEDKVYINPELTLTDLAKQLQTTPGVASKIINQGFDMNFNDFINHHRVEAVKAKLSNPDNNHLTIMSMAYDAGFNSKATFNRAFKKATGKNPKDFQQGM